MTEQSVACGFCGQIVYVSAEALQQSLLCPACGKQMTAPQELDCSFVTPVAAVSQSLTVLSFGRLVLAALPAGVLAAALTLLGGWLIWHPCPPQPPNPPLTIMDVAPVSVIARTPTQPEPPVPTESAPSHGPVVETAPPPMPSVHSHAVQPEQRRTLLLAELRRQLDETHPIYELNQRVELRETTGRLHRGEFLERRADAMIILRDGEAIPVFLNSLDGTTRIRCETAYREAYLEQLLDRRLREAPVSQ